MKKYRRLQSSSRTGKGIRGKLSMIQYNSPVILSFALISLIALILNYITMGLTNRYLFSVYRGPLTNPLTYVRLFTHVLGHADISHYMGNMMYFLLLGPIIEEKYGSRNTLLMILVNAAVTGILNCLLMPNSSLLGASGVVFCFIILSSMTSIEQGKIPLTLILVCLLYLTTEIYNAIFVKDNISQFGHIIGGICGCIFGFTVDRIGKRR